VWSLREREVELCFGVRKASRPPETMLFINNQTQIIKFEGLRQGVRSNNDTRIARCDFEYVASRFARRSSNPVSRTTCVPLQPRPEFRPAPMAAEQFMKVQRRCANICRGAACSSPLAPNSTAVRREAQQPSFPNPSHLATIDASMSL
jgi:hypothetical protein